MTEESAVKVEFDNGHKSRWGAGLFLYRSDGKKSTLRTNRVVLSAATVFGLTSAIVMLNGPVHLSLRNPIVLNGTISNSRDVDVPAAGGLSKDKKPKIAGGKQPRVGQRNPSRMEIVNRPRFGQIPPGTTVRAKLSNGASNGLVKAELLDRIEIQGEGIAETGTTLIGRGSSTEDRLMISFQKMVFRNGETQSIHAEACDASDQTVGLKGSKIGRAASMLAAGIGLNFAGGLADGLQESEVRGGVAVRKSDLRNAALNGSAKASVEESKSIIERWKTQKTVIEVKSGTEICVIFSDN